MFSDSGKWVHKRNTWTPLKTRRHPAGTRKLPLYWTGAAKIEGGSFLFVWGQGPDDVSNSLLRNFTTLKAKTLTGWWFFFCFKNSLKSISGWVVWSGFTALKPLVLGAFFFFFLLLHLKVKAFSYCHARLSHWLLSLKGFCLSIRRTAISVFLPSLYCILYRD